MRITGTFGKIAAVLTAMLSVSIGAGACGGPPVTEVRADRTTRVVADAATTQAVSHDMTDFAVSLYRQLAVDSQNFSFSPVAVAVSLAMTRAGTSGDTHAQLTELLHARGTEHFDEGLGTLWMDLGARAGEQHNKRRSGTVSAQLPATVWVQKGTEIDDAFTEALATAFGSGIQVVDFRSDPASARRAVDSWLNVATNNAFDTPLDQGFFDQSTRLVLASAFSLSAPWDVRFPPTRTSDRKFTLMDGTTIDVPTMSVLEEHSLSRASGDGWLAASIPYLGGDLSMVVIMPTGSDFHAFEQSLDGPLLTSILSNLRRSPIDLSLPRFRFISTLNIGEALKETPPVQATTADGSEFNEVASGWFRSTSKVFHKAALSADEQGTDGAAATVIESGPDSNEVAEVVTIDRPFIVLIRDESTGTLLSIGRVVDPSR